MSDTWKGVPPPSQPDRLPFSPEQEARIRAIVRQERPTADQLADQVLGVIGSRMMANAMRRRADESAGVAFTPPDACPSPPSTGDDYGER